MEIYIACSETCPNYIMLRKYNGYSFLIESRIFQIHKTTLKMYVGIKI